ncbi:ABC transporter permease [Rhizobium etli]|uniref:ABC transporter permease n=1 Tax=Rhizobium etli TaxID=29449 RepID=UPI000383A5A7|nr:ABC transporter permease [Rhizobium etli]AGS25333.1 prutescine ABC transporter permease protein PotI 2 [Rhizobium etli bv. mimosae str. Mim1]
MAAPVYASPIEKGWFYLHRVICGAILLFLIAPILVVIPLSFNSVPFFTYPMPGFSLRWYEEIFTNEVWRSGLSNSLFTASCVTVLATVLGTLAALGLSRPNFPWRPAVMSVLMAPLIVPVVITALAGYFFYADIGLLSTFPGLILAHTTLATPLVVITVTATLSGYDHTLTRAATGLGAPPITAFFRVTLPLILPGIISGSLFAFFTSFGEVVVTLFIAGPAQTTLPKVMFSGMREQISPGIIAAASVLVLFAIIALTTVEFMRRRSERLRGIS